MPDVPSLRDAVPGFSFEMWWGVFGPGNMPRDLVTRLNAEVNKAVQSASMRKFAENEGVVAGTVNAEQFSAIYAKEIQEWENLGKKANIRLD
jgi:tripartite-type tricarboxylate transporter receptor subunit TctC